MVDQKNGSKTESVADILSRAFDSSGTMPPAAAHLILKARLSQADIQRVDQLLEQKRESGLNPQQEALLRDYLHVDSLLTVLKSNARQALASSTAA